MSVETIVMCQTRTGIPRFGFERLYPKFGKFEVLFWQVRIPNLILIQAEIDISDSSIFNLRIEQSSEFF